MNLPSGSRIHRASLCAASAALPVIESISTPAEAGTAKHTFMRTSLKEGRDAGLLAVPEEFRAQCEAIDIATFEGLEGLESELALAYNVVSETTRVIGVNIGRNYGPLDMNEIPMSLDLAGLVPGVEVVVGDLKTGRTFVPPARNNWQVRVGALALARLHGLQSARAGLLHAPEGSRPWWDVTVFDGMDLADFAEQLRRIVDAVRAARADVANNRRVEVVTGEHCLYCPARQACPAQTALVAQLSGQPSAVADELRRLITPQHAAEAWRRLKLAKQVLSDVEGMIRGLASETPIPLGDGRVLGKQTKEQDAIDAEKARPVLEHLFGREAAEKGCEFEASKASIGRGLRVVYEERKKNGKKTTLKDLEAEAFGALRGAGAMTKVPKTTLCEHEAEVGA